MQPYRKSNWDTTGMIKSQWDAMVWKFIECDNGDQDHGLLGLNIIIIIISCLVIVIIIIIIITTDNFIFPRNGT